MESTFKKDLIREFRESSVEYLQWLEIARDRFGNISELEKQLSEMLEGGRLYGWATQKSIYDYRVKLDKDIWLELDKRYQEQMPRLKEIIASAQVQEKLNEEEILELSNILQNMESYHASISKAAADSLYKENNRKKKSRGCLGLGMCFLMIPCFSMYILLS